MGGCEAIRDLLEAKQLGVSYVIAPMVESPYALSKYIAAKNKVFSQYERQYTQFLFNLETYQGYQHRHKLINMAAQESGTDGVVFGRGDYVCSMGRERARVEDEDVVQAVCEVGSLCKEKGIDLVVGGAVAIDAVPNLKRIRNVMLTRFETRKVVFDASALDEKNIAQGLLDAVHFELLWLMNKREYYGVIYREDEARMNTLESRWQVLKNNS